MSHPSDLADRIKELRAKVADLLKEFGDIAPSMHHIHNELLQMESQLETLRDAGLEPE